MWPVAVEVEVVDGGAGDRSLLQLKFAFFSNPRHDLFQTLTKCFSCLTVLKP